MNRFVLTMLGIQVASVLGARDCETQAECNKYNEICADVFVISGNFRDDPRLCVKPE